MDRKELESLLNLGDLVIDGKQKAEELKELKEQICKLEQGVKQCYQEARIQKINQLRHQLEKTQNKITFLETEINNIKINYCAKHGHQFLYNFFRKKCVLCGTECKVDKGYTNLYIDKSIITRECYTSTEYSEHNLSIEIIEKKLIELYEDYAIIKELLQNLCGIFGHYYKEGKVCQCCGHKEVLDYSSGAVNLHILPNREIIKKGKYYFIKKPQYSEIDSKYKLHHIELSDDQNNNLKLLREFHKYIISSGNIKKDIKTLQKEYQKKKML